MAFPAFHLNVSILLTRHNLVAINMRNVTVFQLSDCVALVLAAILCFTLGYHPYFFGDEATVFREIGQASGIIDSTLALSQYKPRLLFNSIWALGVYYELPRWYYAAVSASAMIAICCGLCLIARRWFDATRAELWVLVVLVLASRFGAMLYFDYVAGIIECLSFAIFVWSLYLFDRVDERVQWPLAIFSLLLAVLSVLVHERFIVAFFSVAAAASVVRVFFCCKDGQPFPLRWLGFSAVYAVLPAVVFILLNIKIGVHSLSTGTAGAEVSVGWGTIEAFATYFSNVFFGTNFGHQWFVGSSIVEGGAKFAATSVVVASLSGLWIFWLRTVDRGRLVRCLQLFAVILAMMAIASLPGLERQEARWMFPVSSLVAVLALASSALVARCGLMSVMLLLSAAGWAAGAYGSIYNVYESRTAQALGEGLEGLVPLGGTALMLDADQSAWALGLVGGVDVFSRINVRQRMHIDLYDPESSIDLCQYDFGIIRYGASATGVGKFAQLDINELVRIVSGRNYQASNPAINYGRCTRGATDYANGRNWPEWSWSGERERVSEGVILGPASQIVGRRTVAAENLDRKVLTYFVGTVEPGTSSKFRLQVNWTGAGGEFLGAAIKVVEVMDNVAPYSLFLVAPKGAESGEIYANLHDDENRLVLLERVTVE